MLHNKINFKKSCLMIALLHACIFKTTKSTATELTSKDRGETQEMTSLLQLPEGILTTICEHLSMGDLQHMSQSCKTIGTCVKNTLARRPISICNFRFDPCWIKHQFKSFLSHTERLSIILTLGQRIGLKSPDWIQELPKSLRILNFYIDMTCADLPDLIELVRTCERLETSSTNLISLSFDLTLRFFGRENRHVSTLIYSFRPLKTLQSLKLKLDDPDGVMPEIRHLSDITELAIQSCGGGNLSEWIPKDVFLSVVQDVGHLRQIRHLNLSNNFCGQDGAIILATILLELSSLTELNLANTALYDEGLLVLLPTIKKLVHLASFNLNANALTANSIRILTETIGQLHGLSYIELSNNTLGVDGARALANCKKSLDNLQHMGLSNNNLGTDGALALAPLIAQLKKLEHLSIGRNHIETSAAYALLSRIKKLKNLTHLNFQSNCLGNDVQSLKNIKIHFSSHLMYSCFAAFKA